jgi:hypothetical protein
MMPLRWNIKYEINRKVPYDRQIPHVTRLERGLKSLHNGVVQWT